MTDEVQLVGGAYVGCRVRVAAGTWETGACKKPLDAWIPIDDDLYTGVCEQHAQFFAGCVASVGAPNPSRE